MSVMVMPRARDQWTVDDLAELPDDGLRYELFDGVLVVSAAPSPVHQRVLGACYRLLFVRCTPDLEVFTAPLDFQPTRHRSFQPDVLVARRNAIGVKNLTAPPVLAVEVLSESTRSKDLIFKREMYQSSGVESYWVIDPQKVTFTAYDLVDGAYRRMATAVGGSVVTVTRPFPVAVCPADLVEGR
jgi:Uma2 family endonuclease